MGTQDICLIREPSICHLVTYDRDPAARDGAVVAEISNVLPRLCLADIETRPLSHR